MNTPRSTRNSADLLVQVIYERGQATRAELGEHTGLSLNTILRLVSELRGRGLILESRDAPDGNGRGRPSDMLRINPACGYAVGLEFGESRLTLVITDAVGGVLHWTATDAPPFVPSTSTLDHLAALARDFAAAQGIDWHHVRTLSLALHDLVSAEGEWLSWSNLGGEPVPARAHLEAQLAMPVHVEDVSRAFAEAEFRYGAGRGAPDQIALLIGNQGVGSGAFLNGALMKSASGIGGEIGHIVVEPDGGLCQCGNHGCLVNLIVTHAVVARFEDRLAHGLLSAIKSGEDITFARICQAAELGDKAAYTVLQESATYIARALASTLNILGAPLVIIGGQYRQAGSRFLDDLSIQLSQQVIPVLAHQVEVRYAELSEYASAWGGALQALDRAWANDVFSRQAAR
ncbi:MAG: ROK family transcriptional regulator [Anaerolineae bacterium]|nr:ROK family transcriptional regulator [Anaerolineae bacterium]